MRKIQFGQSDLQVPVLAVGCMRINGLDEKQAEAFLRSAIEQGANFFDHADIYGAGSCEAHFASSLKMNDDLREKLIIQTKCGIRAGMYDFSRDNILNAVDGSLKNLQTDYLDVLLLHRPDALMEPEEVAEAFDILHQNGKVRRFGVSNQNPMQIKLLQKYVKQPLAANQLQLSITQASMITAGTNVNTFDDGGINRDGSVLDFCRLEGITIQPWSPFQHGFFAGTFLDNNDFSELNSKINEVAEKYSVSNTTIALAWLLRHPAKMQPVTGTMNLQRLADCIKAAEVYLEREDWYAIYKAAGHALP